jgi:transcriptional regulator with XRE-family HTH domain
VRGFARPKNALVRAIFFVIWQGGWLRLINKVVKYFVDFCPLGLDRRADAFSKHFTEALAMMIMAERKTFGAVVRREREAKEIGLREMAKKIGVSPTYLSKIERDDFPPPAEDKVRKIAAIIGCDADELLALAGRVASDLTDIIRQRPREMADFLRAAKGLTAEDLAQFARQAQKARERERSDEGNE